MRVTILRAQDGGWWLLLQDRRFKVNSVYLDGEEVRDTVDAELEAVKVEIKKDGEAHVYTVLHLANVLASKLDNIEYTIELLAPR